MTEQKLTVGMICQNDYEWAIMGLESIEPIADEIIIIDGGSEPGELKKLDDFIDGKEKYRVIHNKYPGNNGLQYQEILKYATGDWILVIDSDEVISDDAHLIKEYMKGDKSVYSIRMNHCIRDLAHIDATEGGSPKKNVEYKHYVLNRLYRNREGINYLPTEHTMITGFTEIEHGLINDVIIWHYGKSKEMIRLKEKYKMNVERSKIHTKEFLNWWYSSHILGLYPTKIIDVNIHPSVIKREFYLNEIHR